MSIAQAKIEISECRALPQKSLLDIWKHLENSAVHDFFVGSTWIEAWLKTTKPDASLIVARCDSKPVGAALIARSPRSLHNPLRQEYRLHETGHSRKDAIYIEYNGILTAPGFREASLESMIGTLRKRHARSLEGMAPAHLIVSAASPAFTQLVQKVFPQVQVFRREKSPYVDLHALRSRQTGYLASLSANTRRQLNQARVKIDAQGTLMLERARSVEQALEFLDHLKPLHIARWRDLNKPSGFDNPYFEPLLRGLIRTGVPTGVVDVVRAVSGSKPIGYLVNFKHNGSVLNYTSGFAYEDYVKLKPGLITHLLAIEDADRNGSRRYNFLAGAARYKLSLSNDSEDLCWLRLKL